MKNKVINFGRKYKFSDYELDIITGRVSIKLPYPKKVKDMDE